MAEELFRKEVLDARRNGWLGGVSISQPIRIWSLTLAALVVTVSIGAFLMFATYTRRSTVVGQLVPSVGMAAVLSPATGVVSEMLIVEGQNSTRGQRLAVVTVQRSTISEGSAAEALAANLEERRRGLLAGWEAREKAFATKETGISRQLVEARIEAAHLRREVATRREQKRLAKETLDRLRKLEADRYVSILQIRQHELTWLEHTATIQAMEQKEVSMRRSIAQLDQELDSLPADRSVGESDFKADLSRLEQEVVENEARGALVVSASVSGVVANQLVKLGQSVQAGQPMLNIIPEGGELEADLLVPSRAVGFISVGDPVQLRYQAFPYQKFGHQAGRVRRIARSAMSSADLGALAGAANSNEPFYRVSVSLDDQTVSAYGQREPLRPGMLLEADVLGERRNLIEWVLEPLYALKGRLTEEYSGQ